MTIRGFRVRALGLCVVLLSTLMVQSGTAPRDVTMVAREDGVAGLREEGRYDEALELAIRLAERLETTPGVASWRREDAARLVRTCACAAALPESCRQTLAEADRADEGIRDLVRRGSYRRAYALASQQLKTRRRLLGADHAETAASLMTLGDIRYLRGDRAGASKLRKQGLELRRAILGGRHPLVAESEAALGRSEKSFIPFDQVESIHTTALRLRRDLFGDQSLQVAESLFDLADIHRATKRYDTALDLLQQSLRIRRKLLLPEDPLIAKTLCAIGLVHLQRGAWKKAEPFLRSAARMAESHPDTPAEDRALSLSLYASVLEKRGNLEGAERLVLESVRLYERFFREGLAGYPPNHGLGDWWKIAVLQLKQGKSVEAWASVDRSLSCSLLDQLYPPDSSAAPDWSSGTPPVDNRFCSLTELQCILPGDAAVVGWLEGGRSNSDYVDYPYWGYVIRASGPVVWVQIDAPPGTPAGTMSNALRQCTATLRAAADWPLQAQMKPEFLQLARAAYDERIVPLLPHLDGVRRLYVVKAGSGRHAAFEPLIDSAGRFLGDCFEISYILSSTLLVRTHVPPPAQRPTRMWHALLVGNYSASERGKRSGASIGSRADAQHHGLPSLPGARDEVRSIASLFRSTRVLSGEERQAAALRRLAISDSLRYFDLIHIATHAMVSERSPMESALVFSPSSDPSRNADLGGEGNEDCLLRPQEILSSWRLNAGLVTLSACQSESGTFYATDPMGGVCQALLLTGAKSLLVALWTVDDRATALLMGRFYENLTGSYADARAGWIGRPMSKPQALQEAKRWLREFRDPDGSRPFESPAQWASFTLVGDPGDLGVTDLAQTRSERR